MLLKEIQELRHWNVKLVRSPTLECGINGLLRPVTALCFVEGERLC